MYAFNVGSWYVNVWLCMITLNSRLTGTLQVAFQVFLYET
jgi:hypothetical protein